MSADDTLALTTARQRLTRANVNSKKHRRTSTLTTVALVSDGGGDDGDGDGNGDGVGTGPGGGGRSKQVHHGSTLIIPGSRSFSWAKCPIGTTLNGNARVKRRCWKRTDPRPTRIYTHANA
ncbi:hypothetical protein HZH66_011681 [Vespula vulgaris]|uniref:Uncharacterized protein n=1 Tax=Vespula vulgaris TaxID=7454 RepID=A0A834JCG3_VESVU|nr:hypothetical protein HZH66_011681 [Vespula vulgaris]